MKITNPKSKAVKTSLSLFLAVFLVSSAKAQEFSFQMKFIDAMGNRDSITLGYDVSASDTIDPAFGEVNIISAPYTSAINVRAGNVWFQQNSFPGFGKTAFETKTQILPNICGTGNFWSILPIAEIHIVSAHFPLQVFWNRSLFNDICRNGSVLTSVHPGGWWDTGGFRDELTSMDSAILIQNQFHYLNGADTVNVYWVAFSDSTLLTLGLNEINSEMNAIRIFPNPASDFISVNISPSLGKINQIEFFNSLGQTVKISKQPDKINIRELSTGLYFIKITNTRGNSEVVKLRKI